MYTNKYVYIYIYTPASGHCIDVTNSRTAKSRWSKRGRGNRKYIEEGRDRFRNLALSGVLIYECVCVYGSVSVCPRWTVSVYPRFQWLCKIISAYLAPTHSNTLQHTATHCNTLQQTATDCSTLQHTATRYNTLQRTATHCNTL